MELFRVEDASGIDASSLLDVGKTQPLFKFTYKNDSVDGDFTDLLHRFLGDSNLPHIELVAGCLAVAGPVSKDRVVFTNLSWDIDGRALEDEFATLRAELNSSTTLHFEGVRTVSAMEGVCPSRPRREMIARTSLESITLWGKAGPAHRSMSPQAMPRGSMRLVNDFAANGYGVVTLGPSDYDDISPHGPIAPTDGAPVACVGAGTGLGETSAIRGFSLCSPLERVTDVNRPPSWDGKDESRSLEAR